MLAPLAILLACQLAGETLVRSVGLPLPGPVAGLVLLAGALAVHSRLGGPSPEMIEAAPIGRLAAVLTGSLGILFVPAGVGIVQHVGLFGEHGVAIVVALVVSTVTTLIVTVAVFLLVARLVRGGEAP